MGYRDIYKESNEQAEERFSLVMERIAEIAEKRTCRRNLTIILKDRSIFVTVKECVRKAEKDTLKDASLTECEKRNAGFYDGIKAENYGKKLWKSDLCSRKTGRRIRTDFICTVCKCRKRITDAYAEKNERDDHGRIIC